MLYNFVLFIAFLFHNASFAEAQQSCRMTGISGLEECGTLKTKSRSFLAGGRQAAFKQMPWLAGVYSRRTNPLMQVCGGSVVSPQVVISAAHCFTDNTQKLPAADFAVAAGKLYRPWNDKMDIYAQKSEIQEIRIPARYHGATTNFQDDIALLILTTPFEMNLYVQPVCLDFDYDMDQRHLMDGNLGKVAGWGRTDENAKASPTLQVVDLPSVDIQRCYDSVEPVFRPAITSDKICAGNTTGGTAVCMGDSGGGLVFPETTPNGNRFYLRGVVSTAPRSADDNLCNIYTYATFTHVLKHEHFIREVMLETSGTAQSKPRRSSQQSNLDAEEEEPTSKPLADEPDEISSGLIRPDSLSLDTEEVNTAEDRKDPKDSPLPLSGTGQSDPGADAEYTAKVIEEKNSSSPPNSTDETERPYTSTALEPTAKDTKDPEDSSVPKSGTRQSDPDATTESTVKVIEELSSSPNSTDKTERPFLSTASQPFLSTEKKPEVPFENQSAKSEVNQKVQSIPNLPVQKTENQKPKSIGGLLSQSVGNQEQSKGTVLPLSTGYKLPLTKHQPQSTGSRPVHFEKSYPTTYTSLSNPDLTFVDHKWPSDLGLFDYYRHNHYYPHHRDYENHPHGYHPHGYHHQGFQHQRHHNVWQGLPYNQW